MALETLDLWNLVRKRPQIDPRDLAEAVRGEVHQPSLDYRSRLLVRDSVEALRFYWGSALLAEWLETCPEVESIRTICAQEFDKVGFPSLKGRLRERTDPEDVRSFLWDLAKTLPQKTEMVIGDSVALILPEFVRRRTESVEIVSEVPVVIRENPRLLGELKLNHNLQLRHVPAHYYPSDWLRRAYYFETFGRLRIHLIDVYDVFLSKLASDTLRNFNDLIVLASELKKELVIRRVKSSASFLAAPRLLELATANWKVLYGEPLPQ